MRLTPKGFRVSAAVAWISASSASGGIAPFAMTPKPPASEMAATRFRSDTQVMAPPMIPKEVPRKSRPRRQRWSRCARASGCAVGSAVMSGSCGIEAIGGMEGTERQFRIFLGDEDAHLDLGGGNHLDIDPLLGQGAEHLLRHAGVRAHADPDHRDLGD